MIHADENKIILVNFVLFGHLAILLLYTRYFTDPSIPMYYIAALYICNLFNMCNVLFVSDWNF